MGLESGTYIDSLVATNPVSGDPKSEGDNHIRLVKATIKATFPSLTGAVTATQTELNLLDGVTASTAELNTLDGITASTAELNLMDGVTVTTAQINGVSPALTGTPTAPTAALGTDTTQIATTEFVQNTYIDNAYPDVTGNAGKVLQTDGSSVSWELAGSNPNLVINSNFGPNQEDYDADGVASLASGEYGHDMWKATGGSVIYTKETNGDITINSTTGAAAGSVYLYQKNDELVATDGETITGSFEVVSLDSSVNFYMPGLATQTISTTGVKTFTATADSNGYLTFSVVHSGAGTVSPNFRFKNLKIERGSSATQYQVPEPRAEELRCYRYYYLFGGEGVGGMATRLTATNKLVTVPTRVQMRGAVTASANAVYVRDYSDATGELLTVSGTTVQHTGIILVSGSHSTSYDYDIFYIMGANSYIELDARY